MAPKRVDRSTPGPATLPDRVGDWRLSIDRPSTVAFDHARDVQRRGEHAYAVTRCRADLRSDGRCARSVEHVFTHLDVDRLRAVDTGDYESLADLVDPEAIPGDGVVTWDPDDGDTWSTAATETVAVRLVSYLDAVLPTPETIGAERYDEWTANHWSGRRFVWERDPPVATGRPERERVVLSEWGLAGHVLVVVDGRLERLPLPASYHAAPDARIDDANDLTRFSCRRTAFEAAERFMRYRSVETPPGTAGRVARGRTDGGRDTSD